ncbi:hypothetical protein DL95DRAFT_502219 [Leptodontidium sp. 2 PMI_412]|nr:hypothetical protein DL95DRAFT_502219 [Leptodontidium sp. 2 PMI_412]
MKILITSLLAFAVAASPLDLENRQTGRTAVVDLAGRQGPANQLVSGILYGTPDTLNQIPDDFYTGPKLKYFRAGGAQLFNVGERGWHWGEYGPRFQSTLSNYKRNAWLGDNGNWASYDIFLDRLITDIKANNMLPGLKIDIWNEPDLTIFWKRPLSQFLETWKRTYQRFRADGITRTVPLIGPSYAGQPHSDNPWWTEFMQYIVAQNVVPDQYTWHILGPANDPVADLQNNVVTMDSFFARYGAPKRSYCINEYINSGEDRVNAANAWHMARLERYNATGLQANWLSTGELHDFLAELSMTGTKLTTTGSGDRALDVFATLGSDRKVRVLAGVRAQTGTWEIELRNLVALGLPVSGSLTIQTLGFDDPGLRSVVTTPRSRGTYTHTYSGGVLRFPVYQTQVDAKTAWAFEFRV